MELPGTLLIPGLKNKKTALKNAYILSKKTFLIFPKWSFLVLRIKHFRR